MKKIIIGIVCIAVIGGLGLFFVANNKDNSDYIKPEFVTSIKDIDESLPTIIMFKKPTCEPCVDMEIIYKRMHEDHEGEFNLVYYNTDDFSNKEGQEAIVKYEVIGTPTSIILDTNKETIKRFDGVVEREEVEAVLFQN